MGPNKTAIITGYTGQDGTFLTKLLLDNGYKVVGLVRRISTEPPRRVRGKFDFSDAIAAGQLVLEDGDHQSISSLIRILQTHQPDEIYNLAWQSHVGMSFKIPEVSLQDYAGYVNLITAVESVWTENGKLSDSVRIYQASTSEMFGDVESLTVPVTGFDEDWPLRPNSPYAIAKYAAHQFGRMKRKQGLFVSNGILFNHESEIRGGDFVTQKIIRGAVNWLQTGEPIRLGNLDARRDWGYAGDYVKAMHAMLQAEKPDDYIVATGTERTVREFVEVAFKALGRDITWASHGGQGGDREFGVIGGSLAVAVDPEFYRPNEVGFLNGDASKAARELNWTPETSFDQMIQIMIDAERERIRGE